MTLVIFIWITNLHYILDPLIFDHDQHYSGSRLGLGFVFWPGLREHCTFFKLKYLVDFALQGLPQMDGGVVYRLKTVII